MKILVFSHKKCWISEESPIGYASDGGFVFQMQALCTLVDEVRLIVPVLNSFNPTGEIIFKDKKISICPFPLLRGHGMMRKIFVVCMFFFHIPKLMLEIKRADIVHAPVPSDLGVLGLLLAQVMGKRIFARHCGNWFIQTSFTERFLKWYFVMFASSKNIFLATGGSDKSPSDVNPFIQWVFSTSLTAKEITQTRNSLKNFKESITLITVSRQEKEKGTDTVIDALRILASQGMNYNLIIVGEGSYLKHLKDKVQAYGLANSVKFTGKLSNTDVHRQLAKADLFCYPTRASEGFPKVVLEAMAHGIPVITNPVSGLRGLIGTSGSGVILQSGTPDELAEKIVELMGDPNRYLKFSESAFSLSMNFTLEKWADFIAATINSTWNLKLRRSSGVLK